MDIDRFRAAVREVHRIQCKPTIITIAAIDIDPETRTLLIHPKKEGVVNNLPDDYYLDGNCVIDRPEKENLFQGELIRIDEDKQYISVKWNAGLEPTVGEEMCIFPPDYLKKILEWSEGLETLPPLYKRIESSSWPNEEETQDRIPELVSVPENLRERQRVALSVGRKQIGLIWGPPGTGKTYTLGAIAGAHIQEGRKVLAVGLTNQSVDSIVLKVDDAVTHSGHKLEDGVVLRLGYPQDPELFKPDREHLLRFQRMLHELAEVISITKAEKDRIEREIQIKKEKDPDLEAYFSITRDKLHELEDQRKGILDNLLPKAKMVATTIASLTSKPKLYGAQWDVIILDETSLVALPVVAFLLSLNSKQWLFAGDPAQLAPFYYDKKVKENWLKEPCNHLFKRSLFDHLHVLPGERGDRSEDLFRAGVMVRLNQQSRMNESLCQFISSTFYDGDLHVVDNPRDPWWNDPLPSSPRVVVDPTHILVGVPRGVTRPSGKARNPKSAQIAAGIVKGIARLVDDLQPPVSILVLSPYRYQSDALRTLLAGTEGIQVRTVRRAQGSEATLVVLDVAEINNLYLTKSSEARKVWNVAISRAQAQVIIVEKREDIKKNGHIRAFLNGAQDWYPDWNKLLR